MGDAPVEHCSIIVGNRRTWDLTDADSEGREYIPVLVPRPYRSGIRACCFGQALLACFIHLFALIVSTMVIIVVLCKARLFVDPEAYHVRQFNR